MFQQPWSIEVVILPSVSDGTANGGARKRPIVQVLPLHRERREMPVVSARHAGAVSVRFLMTTAAIQSRHTLPLRPTHDIRNVTASLVALLRVVRGCVAIDATRMS
jgi:hypothetical protein